MVFSLHTKEVKHFTATTYLFVKEINKTLMIWHPTLLTWLPPGGHIEENESPEETARREIFEEVGEREINFLFPNTQNTIISDDRVETLMMPHFLIKENIELNHFHMDWIFFATLKNKVFNSPEEHTIKLFSQKEIELDKKIFTNVLELAIHGFKLLNK